MKHKFPVLLPKGTAMKITQGFSREIFVNGKYISGHEAIDWSITRGSSIDSQFATIGCPIVMDIDVKVVGLDDFGPMNERGNGIRVEWFENGKTWNMVFWHTIKNYWRIGDTIPAYKIISRVGNTGFVRPTVTTDNPLNGGHCHNPLSHFDKTQYGNTNIVYVNMLDYFDVMTPCGYTDESIITSEDSEPLKWAFEKLGLKTAWEQILYILKLVGWK